MPNSSSERENLEQQLAANSARIQHLVEEQYNVEVTRSVALCFSTPDQECARALLQALFAKGTRVLTQEPEERDGRYHIRVGVKRSLRDTVREEYTADLVHTASGMNASYDGWDVMTDDAAEETQPHERAQDPAPADAQAA